MRRFFPSFAFSNSFASRLAHSLSSSFPHSPSTTDIETSPTKLPITKLIATKKSDAISMHKRILEKSTAAIYYSDGSFKNGWAWGAAVEWVRTPGSPQEGTVGRKLREELGMCDPTDAEMGGMRKALEAFASAGKLKEQELLIFSDSQAAITLL